MKLAFLTLVFTLFFLIGCGGTSEKEIVSVPTTEPTNTPQPTQMPEPEWREFASETGRFTVLFPEEPTEQNQIIDHPEFGEVVFNMLAAPAEFGMYMVSYSDYPKGVTPKDNEGKKAWLDNARDGAIANVNGTFVSEKHVTVNGFSGRHVVFETPSDGILLNGGDGVVRMYIVGDRFYQLVVVGAKGLVADEDIDRFINSFTFQPE